MALDFTNQIYDNVFMANKTEDLYNSHLDLLNFCTINNELVGVPGMTHRIHVYTASNGTQELGIGEGNTDYVEVSYTAEDHVIKLAQNRFAFTDEEIMTDPYAIDVGMENAAIGIVNFLQDRVYDAFKNATQVVNADTPDFGAVVDASALLRSENIANEELFAIIHPQTEAAVRKVLEPQLHFVEAWARQGYIGTVAGVNFYVKRNADPAAIVGGTREAVTVFNKTGMEISRERDENIRKNIIYARKYFVVAMTNQTKAFKILLGADSASANLTSLQIGSIPLTPAFNPATTTYTATTKQATAKIRAAAEAAGATIEITNGETTVENGAQATLEVGENTITVEVTNGNTSKEYTVTVTREAP